MGDPVTMAMIGAGVGAITNRRNPLQGALLGGALGGFGGAAMAANPAATATMTGASAVPAGASGVAAMNPSIAWNAAEPMAAASMPTYATTGGSTGLIPSMTAPVTMMDRLGAIGQFAKENPMLTQMGASAAKDIFTQPPPPPIQSGLLRGSQIAPQEQPQYAMGLPNIRLI